MDLLDVRRGIDEASEPACDPPSPPRRPIAEEKRKPSTEVTTPPQRVGGLLVRHTQGTLPGAIKTAMGGPAYGWLVLACGAEVRALF